MVVPEQVWEQRTAAEVHLGRWLIENMPRGYELELPDRHTDRPTPFIDYATDAAADERGAARPQ